MKMSEALTDAARKAVLDLVENDLNQAELMTALTIVNASVIYSTFTDSSRDERTVNFLMLQTRAMLDDVRTGVIEMAPIHQ